MKSFLTLQYEMVLDARAVLLKYCSTISDENFCLSNPNFGRGGSIRNLMVHIGNTYRGWLSEFIGVPFIAREYSELVDVKSCESYFESTNDLVFAFIEKYEDNYLQSLQVKQRDGFVKVTPIQLFTHCITHEFHHKGQILSISRSFGYTPVDTDIMR
jgi:uncharacterized damage-inducible protein DinB